MLTDISALFATDGTKQIDMSFDMSDTLFYGESCIKQVVVKGKISSSASVVELNCEASFDYTACCDRCAELATRPMKATSLHTIVQNEYEATDIDTIVAPDKRIDLTEIVREDIVLALPIQFLCKDDCKGICDQCGTNLNQKQCKCEKITPSQTQTLGDLI